MLLDRTGADKRSIQAVIDAIDVMTVKSMCR